jgi:hypothetical protein
MFRKLMPSLTFRTPWTKTLASVFREFAMERPAASSLARLMRRPELRASKVFAALAEELASALWAESELMLLPSERMAIVRDSVHRI